MNDDIRKQVVALLRCAADCSGIAGAFQAMTGIEVTGAHYRPGGRAAYPVWDMAVKAREAIDLECAGLDVRPNYDQQCLMAAQRVEEGTWP
jgi:hypothetical protein